MKYDFIQSYCLAKGGAAEEYKEAWDAILYTVGGKIFALVGNDGEGAAVIAVKLNPDYGAELQAKYKDITPAYHFNKTHWSAMLLGGDTPEIVLKTMLDQSYELVFNSLTRKIQEEIRNRERAEIIVES
jgi:predicted DNA-binding protein (MmcQ/YjbR family)